MDERGRWQVVAVVAAVGLAVFGLVRWLQPPATPQPVRVEGGGASPAPGSAAGEGPGLFVHVAGAVRRPGLYRVGPGARIDVAVRRAGGPTARADLTAVNLAAPVEDGQQVVVPSRVPGAAAAVGDRPLVLATATPEQLEELDGIGETLAERIVEHRDEHGLSSVEDLRDVDGIGESRFGALKEAFEP